MVKSIKTKLILYYILFLQLTFQICLPSCKNSEIKGRADYGSVVINKRINDTLKEKLMIEFPFIVPISNKKCDGINYKLDSTYFIDREVFALRKDTKGKGIGLESIKNWVFYKVCDDTILNPYYSKYFRMGDSVLVSGFELYDPDHAWDKVRPTLNLTSLRTKKVYYNTEDR